MDAQLKRGFFDICILAAVKQEDSYGYKIVKDVSEYIDISESTLYPILRRLESANYLNVYSREHNGRLRKYYHLTEEGQSRIQEFLLEWKDIQKIYEFIERKGGISA